jgi:hypothetical protein
MKERSLKKDLGDLLDTLCVEWGFCIPPSDFDRIVARQRLTADEFAAEVLRAEGFNPEYEKQWHRKIKRRFTDRFGEAALADDHPGIGR